MNARLASEQPVLVTGSHRSGTTWVGRVLGLSARTAVTRREPFNLDGYALRGVAQNWFPYPADIDRTTASEIIGDILRGRSRVWRPRDIVRFHLPGRPRAIVKDPIACLSSEWLARTFEFQVLVLVRHPAAFAMSLERMGWSFPFESFLNQPALMEDHLHDLRADMLRSGNSIIEQAALLWLCLYRIQTAYIDRNPEWIVVTHEELSIAPIERFRAIYEALGLRWSHGVEDELIRLTDSRNPTEAPDGVTHALQRDSRHLTNLWREKLDPDDVRHIRRVTEPVASNFYGPETWG